MNRALPLLAVGLVVGGATAYLLVDSGTLDTSRTSELEVRIESLENERAALERDLEKERRLRSEQTKQSSEVAEIGQRTIDAIETRMAMLEEERDKLSQKLKVAETVETPEEVIVETGFTDEQLTKALGSLGANFQDVMMGTGEAFREKMKQILARGGEGTLERITRLYEETSDLGRKTVLAHALAQTGDPAALEALKAVARNPEAGMFDIRTATHGLAFSSAEGLESFYLEIAESPDIEIGARANSAFGLARRNDEGIEVYAKTVDEAFRKKDPFAVAYLQGFMLLGKRAVPVMESRLTTIRDKQARISLVELLATHGNRDSVPALRALAADPTTSEDIRKRADQVAEQLAKKD